MTDFVHTFDNIEAPTRSDGVPWTQIKIEEAATAAGPWTLISTQAWNDADPSTSEPTSVTVATATRSAGWYRPTWVDGNGAQWGPAAPVYSSPHTSDLCTLLDVRRLMQKPDGLRPEQDKLIQSLIQQVSVEIGRWCEREFAPPVDGDVRTFEWDCSGQMLSLAPFDLREVTSVVLDGDLDSPSTLTTDEYRLLQRSAGDGTYTGVRLQPLSLAASTPSWDVRQVTITGDWGMAFVPDDVRDAAAITVVHRMKVNVAAFRAPEDQSDGPTPPKRGIPPEAMQLLNAYKRMAIA